MDQTCPVVHKSRRPQARLKRQSHCFTYIVVYTTQPQVNTKANKVNQVRAITQPY
jgi:hypothetical protein